MIKSQGTCSNSIELDQALFELGERIQRGESVVIDQYVDRFPEDADKFIKAYDAMLALSKIARPVNEVDNIGGPVSARRTLGDFRLIREIGRGGMGVVYEAEQISLGRTVALKVLPYAALLDERAIQRFKNEARAAATMDHPNIVPVYAVGEERGVYYYAMALIAGQNMAEVIAEMRTAPVKSDQSELDVAADSTDDERAKSQAANSDTQKIVKAAISTQRSAQTADFFRTAASLGIQAAEALHFAHQNGVLHRDIKPANLLLDAKGKLWVTDFGLARLDADAGMTMTGDLLGTLRYMSPEQALGNQPSIDHRSDVYSLGVTLYELVAQQPSFDTKDRQALLKQIAFTDPTPLRKLNPSIPSELETIIQKAIDKNPADRYQTAGELADDLRRYLENKPIVARRSSFPQRAVKLYHRHPAVGIAVGLGLLGITISAIIAMVVVNRANSQARDNLEFAHTAVEKGSGALDGLMYLFPAEDHHQQQVLEQLIEFYSEYTKLEGDDIWTRQQVGNSAYKAAEIYNLQATWTIG